MVIKATPITLEQLKRKEVEAAQLETSGLGEAREVSARAVSARAVEARAVAARAVAGSCSGGSCLIFPTYLSYYARFIDGSFCGSSLSPYISVRFVR